MFILFLTVPEGSTVCTHAVHCMLLWPRPSQIHPLLFVPSLHVFEPQWVVHVLADDQRCLVGDQCYENIYHESSRTKTQKHTDHSSLYIPLYCGSTCLPSLCLVPSTFSVSLCSCEWPGCLKLKDTVMCSDICDSGRGEERKHCCFTVALCVIKWMMTKHFISAQWVRYTIWGSQSYLWWVEWIRPVGVGGLS